MAFLSADPALDIEEPEPGAWGVNSSFGPAAGALEAPAWESPTNGLEDDVGGAKGDFESLGVVWLDAKTLTGAVAVLPSDCCSFGPGKDAVAKGLEVCFGLAPSSAGVD